MNNWLERFEKHPAKIIITLIFTGTITIIALTHAYDETTLNIVKATVDQHKAKIESLEFEIAKLREENKKYLEWLSGTPNTIPYLEQKIKSLNEEIHPKKIVGHGNVILDDVQVSGTVIVGTPAYSNTTTLNIGEGWVDAKTNATFGIGPIAPDFTMSAVLGLPGAKPQELKQVKAGNSWIFTKDAKRYQLTVLKIDWYTNKAEIKLVEIEDAEKK